MTIFSGSKLRQARKLKKLTMKELGNLIGISSTSIYYYEKGIRVPSVNHAYMLADGVEVPLINLTEGK